MKKQLLTFILASTIAISLAGCGKKDQETPAVVSPSAEAISALPATPTSVQMPGADLTSVTVGVGTQAASPSATTDTITLTIPESMVNRSIANPQEAAIQKGYQNAILESDNSLSVTMSQTAHSELLSKITTAIDTTFQQLITDGTFTPYITNITHDPDFTTVTVFVNKESYTSTFVDLTPTLVGQYAAFYQAYKGMEPNVTIKVVDNLTSNTINTIMYPSAGGSSSSSSSANANVSAAAGSSTATASGSSTDSNTASTGMATSTATEPKPLVQSESKKYTITEDTKLYTETDKESKVLADVKKGTTFTSSESSEYFYKTTINGQTGFIRKKFASVQAQ